MLLNPGICRHLMSNTIQLNTNFVNVSHIRSGKWQFVRHVILYICVILLITKLEWIEIDVKCQAHMKCSNAAMIE